MDWEEHAKGILLGQMGRRGLGPQELARKLEAIGINETRENLSNKINRGKFSFAFFLQCAVAMGVDEIQHDIKRDDVLKDL